MTQSFPRLASRTQIGLQAPPVHIEVHVAAGLPLFAVVGMPATAVKESRERVRAALLNSQFEFPAGRIIVNLAPADVPKEGGRFDLPIALGILLATGQLKLHAKQLQQLDRYEFYGELALSGELKAVRGLLLAAAHARQNRHRLIVPRDNLEEARIAAREGAAGATHLLEVCAHLQGKASLPQGDISSPVITPASKDSDTPDLRDVHGQLQAKRALAVAAAGAHSLLMVGPPGSGKSMLAQRLPALLPPLTEDEALEAATIASVSAAGFDPRTFGRRPLRAPHHSASFHSIVGGGRHVIPGEVSLAHNGVLFLDELPEFDRRALEALREPIEAGVINISRVNMQAEYPAVFQLIAAMNPCPCGYLGDPSGRCNCSATRVARYRERISGPLLDRIDLRIEVPALPESSLAEPTQSGESSAAVALRVKEARDRQRARAGKLNSRISAREINEYCGLDAAGRRLLWQSRAKLGMSVRSYHRTLRVARTIADLEGTAEICATHVAEALQLKRTLE